jgi:hypothetical protein
MIFDVAPFEDYIAMIDTMLSKNNLSTPPYRPSEHGIFAHYLTSCIISAHFELQMIVLTLPIRYVCE